MDIEIKVTYMDGDLRRERKNRGITQAELAEMTGLNVRTLQCYEQGTKDINNAKLSTLLKICLALNCDLMDILTDKETRSLMNHYVEKYRGAYEF